MMLEIECNSPSPYFDVPYRSRYLVRTRALRSIETFIHRIHRIISKRVELILGSDNGIIY